ncbi:DUF1403 family protein [uncultured Roseobacter sp.]|uniref:DUF1403 family protein n=1 Tax=uncultured Roseobacter sp. TaxID=114847 RepID=UPI00345CFE5D
MRWRNRPGWRLRIRWTSIPMTDRAAQRFFDRLVELGLAKELIGRSTFRLGPDHAWTLAMSCNPGGRLGVADCSAIAGCQP